MWAKDAVSKDTFNKRLILLKVNYMGKIAKMFDEKR